ncbi:hypothetical protein HHX47_DHR3001176 [Lentinula edodes]|nr:hypothetical protein HHX47_DHR3001176 [Lentinula edodes]
MTESCGMCAILPPEMMRYSSVGLPVPSIELKLLDVKEAGYLSTNKPPQGESVKGRGVLGSVLAPLPSNTTNAASSVSSTSTNAATVAAKPNDHAHDQMDVSGDAQLTLTQRARKTSSTLYSNASRNNTFTNTRDAGTLPTTIRFPPLFSSDFGPAALLYPSPTLTTHINFGEDLGLTYPHSYDSNDRNDLHSNSNPNPQVNNGGSHSDNTYSAFNIPRPTIELPLDELLRGMDRFDGMEGMEGLDGGDDMDGLRNQFAPGAAGGERSWRPWSPAFFATLSQKGSSSTTTNSTDTPSRSTNATQNTTSLVPPSKNNNANDFYGEDESQDVEMFDHSSSAYDHLNHLYDDNPNNEHISSFDYDLNSAEPIQIPITTVSGNSLHALFGDSPGGRSDGRLLTPFEETLSFSGQHGHLSRHNSHTSSSSHHTHLSNHEDDAESGVDVDVESDNSDSESDLSRRPNNLCV